MTQKERIAELMRDMRWHKNSELNRIDACFVDGNADGITEIRKNAEEDSGLSSWNRLRIMNECTLALMDLGAENLLRQMDRNPQGGR